MSMALFSSSPTHLPALPSSSKTLFLQTLPYLCLPLTPKRRLVFSARASANGSGPLAAVEDQQISEASAAADSKPKPALSEQESLGPNFSPPPAVDAVANFEDSRWVNGTWDLKQFQEDGKTNWDAVIDAEVKRRKWFEDNPESTSNDNPIVFDTSIIPWWAWMKRFHLPEAELLNGRAAMIGFFMAYLVDSLTGVGLVDQMGNFFCKTLLFVAVAGVLLIRKNEDIETLKKLVEETTFYDKQWQATWQDEKPSSSEKN